MKKFIVLLLSAVVAFSTPSCTPDGKLNLFSLAEERAFGLQVTQEIEGNPSDYPILPRSSNREAYSYVEGIMNLLLESDLVNYDRSKFEWSITIIEQNVINAFAAPGGQLFFYTGFLKYAQSEAELAGVIAHEIAHSDRRHATTRMTRVYGLQLLSSILLGEAAGSLVGIVADLSIGIASLSFSRNNEFEADEFAVRYLHSIRDRRNYDATAIKDFFDRLVEDGMAQDNGGGNFLRTHPYGGPRKDNIDRVWRSLGSPEGNKFVAEYADFKRNHLP